MGHSDKMKVIQSGSKAEGLDLKGSDLDLMSITPTFKVYQSETEVVRDGLTVPLIMNNEDSQPCFTQLRLLDHHQIFKNMCEKNQLGYMLSSEQSSLAGSLFALNLSKACWFVPDSPKTVYSSENKHQYFKYKYDLSHLLIGLNSDAVAGWLLLASFFYVHKNYFASLSVMNYALQKCTEEKVYSTRSEYTFIQNQELYQMKNEKLYTVLKAMTIEALIFHGKSSLLPKELQEDAIYDLLTHNIFYYPLSFAYFLSFLCFYNLHDFRSSRYYLQKLKSTTNIITSFNFGTTFFSPLFDQLMGDTYFNRHLFQETGIPDQTGTLIMCVAAEKLMNEFKSYVPVNDN
ncbi:coxA [Mytilus edulis]|uniref:CoxA n=1 Tax=Mytilus edulis TaxID=6550 RepID=A0A8S3PSP6_MYTED|nr:coxA [Mytilus edulis]